MIETERLILRQWKETDAAPLSKWDWIKMLCVFSKAFICY